jgi:hypothetical protein
MGKWRQRAIPRQAGLSLLTTGALLTALSCGGGNLTTPTTPTTGTLDITTTTSGANPDPDGYTFAIDAGSEVVIGVNASVQRTDIILGNHTIQLAGLTPNCTASGDNPRTVSIAAGQNATVGFTVTCSAIAGGIQITTTTTGSSLDPDGYNVTIDGAVQGSIGTTGTTTITQLTAGDHLVGLSGITLNCQVQGDNPRPATVSGGGTAQLSFAATCSALPPGTLRWQRLQSGTDLNLFGVWGSSATDVVVVAGNNQSATAAAILHYDGHQWSQQITETGIVLSSVWGRSANDMFVVGGMESGSHGLFQHFDGAAWSAMSKPGPAALNTLYDDVWGSSGTDVFAVGIYWDTDPNAIIAHYDGTKWSMMTVPMSLSRWLRGVSGTSSHDVWTVGFVDYSHCFPPDPCDGESVAWHYDGSRWTEASAGLGGSSLEGVWSHSPSDVFAVGSGLGGGVVVHYDGHTWSPMVVPPVIGLWDVWGTSASDVYAVGDDAILHYDGKSWTKVSDQGGSDVWGSSPTDVFVVGSGGTILHGIP